MRVAPAQPVDLTLVMDALSERNADELAQAGLDPVAAQIRFTTWLLTFGGYALRDDGDRPLCVLGIVGDPVTSTWFVAAERYWHDRRAQMATRRALKRIRAERGPLCTVSASRHPDTARWFRFLGYEKVAEKDGLQSFVYR